MAKKINHRGRGGYRELLFSLCPLCSLWFSEAHFQKIIKSCAYPIINQVNKEYPSMIVNFYYFLVAMASFNSINRRWTRDLRRCLVNKSAFIRGSLYFSTDQKKRKTHPLPIPGCLNRWLI